jgi:enoyl-CoA hydratase/carnithine racemase
MDEQRVKIVVEGGVADVRLTRADKHNALDAAMFQAISEAGHSLASRKDVRAVVLSGEGPSFCAGLDFQSFAAMKGTDGAPKLFEANPDNPANRAQDVAYVWKRVPAPVIAAVHGVAYGGGLQLALGADIRLAHPGARFSVMEIKWGLVPDMSGTQTLRDLVRLDVAKELTFTGRVVDAEEALKLGLVTRICDDPRAEALTLARTIAEKSPDAIRASKKLLEDAWHADAKTGLALEASLQRSLIGRPNQVESIAANFEKRPPRFRDPE